MIQKNYHQVSYIRRTLVGNKIVDRSDVVGASPLSAAPTTSSFSTEPLASLDWATVTATRDEKHLSLGIRCLILEILRYGSTLQIVLSCAMLLLAVTSYMCTQVEAHVDDVIIESRHTLATS